MSFNATAGATDPLGLSDSDVVSIPNGGATGVRVVRVSAYENRVNWGNAVDDTVQGPDLLHVDPFLSQKPGGPVTLGTTFTMLKTCRIVGVRIYKHPALAGSIPIKLWDHTGTELAVVTPTWVSDGGGWREVLFTSPVTVTNGVTYDAGFYYDGTGDTAPFKYLATEFVWNGGLPMVVYPFHFENYSSGGAGKVGGSWNKPGSGITFSNDQANRWPADYYIDPIAEWDDDLPGYSGGSSYYSQFVNGTPNHQVPFGIDFADPQYLSAYAALGLNTLFAGSASDEYIAAVKTAGLDWYPTLHDDDMSGPVAVQEDTALAALVRGYQLTDEPEFNAGVYSPSVLRTWANHCRAIDSTRPIWLNLGRLTVQNQDFVWTPSGITADAVNQQWRDYMAIPDIASVDMYSLAGTSSFDGRAAGLYNRYGLWTYASMMGRLHQLTDGRVPLWSSVETTSEIPGLPTPDQVKKACWATLIAGARGIMLFDHRFADSDVTQNFAAMLSDSAMSAAVTALATQISSLSAAILAPDAGLVSSVASSNTTEGPIGGTHGVPIHFTSRVNGANKYLFAQGIRPGATTGTFTIPSAPSKTITVIGESRTVSSNGSGVFSDTFAADYSYHLYTWT